MENTTEKPLDFIRQIIAEDLQTGKHPKPITRFPPEPNGFLHIGHAKSICLNFGVGEENDSICHMRFDDTNPSKEESVFVDSIKKDVQWLGFSWGDNLYFASDYFEKLHQYAVQLIQQGDAYVCELTAEQTREYRGTLTEPGKESPFRNRTVEENIELFEGMKNGEFEEGSHALRAKIDMNSPNLNLRDPIFTGLSRHPIIALAIVGVSTLCMITPTVFLIPSKGLPIRCVLLSLKITARFMTGFLIHLKHHVTLDRLNLLVSTSPILC